MPFKLVVRFWWEATQYRNEGEGMQSSHNECVIIDCIVRVADQGPPARQAPVHLWTMQSVTPHCSI